MVFKMLRGRDSKKKPMKQEQQNLLRLKPKPPESCWEASSKRRTCKLSSPAPTAPTALKNRRMPPVNYLKLKPERLKSRTKRQEKKRKGKQMKKLLLLSKSKTDWTMSRESLMNKLKEILISLTLNKTEILPNNTVIAFKSNSLSSNSRKPWRKIFFLRLMMTKRKLNTKEKSMKSQEKSDGKSKTLVTPTTGWAKLKIILPQWQVTIFKCNLMRHSSVQMMNCLKLKQQQEMHWKQLRPTGLTWKVKSKFLTICWLSKLRQTSLRKSTHESRD